MLHEKVKEINIQIEHLKNLIKQDCQSIKFLQKQSKERREQIKQLREERRKIMFSRFEKEER
jgi:late competence protein required for DNA uptake (superfamily II DNA/RNA helicase)